MAIRGIGGERKAWSHPSASSLAASATWKSFSIATIATQANIDNTSATNPRRAPSSAAPPTSSRTMISSAVRPIDPRE